jgi:hypothetical protein
VKRFVCKKLPHPCQRSSIGQNGGAELYGNVQYNWIFHHPPTLKVYKNGELFKKILLHPYDEAGLHKLWSTYFPKIAPPQSRRLAEDMQARRNVTRNSTLFSRLRSSHTANATATVNTRA